MENSMELPLKTKNRVSIWSNNPTPRHASRQNSIRKGTCTPMFIVALFTVAKTWKQPKCPSTDEWIKVMWYLCIYNGILLTHKKEWNNAICSNMDGPRDNHTKWSKSDKEKYHMISLICGILKNDTDELIYKIGTDSQT